MRSALFTLMILMLMISWPAHAARSGASIPAVKASPIYTVSLSSFGYSDISYAHLTMVIDTDSEDIEDEADDTDQFTSINLPLATSYSRLLLAASSQKTHFPPVNNDPLFVLFRSLRI